MGATAKHDEKEESLDNMYKVIPRPQREVIWKLWIYFEIFDIEGFPIFPSPERLVQVLLCL